MNTPEKFAAAADGERQALYDGRLIMMSRDQTDAPRSRRRSPHSRSRLLRAWAIVSAAYVLIAAAGSAGPLSAAIGQAQTAQARPAAAQGLPHRREPAGGPIPDAPDSPSEKMAKAVGAEILLLFGPPLLLLWFGWDVWFALTGFFPAVNRTSRRRAEAPAGEGRAPDERRTGRPQPDPN